MPPTATFDTRRKISIAFRYGLCWGLRYDHPSFSEKLAEHGISTARGDVGPGTIRSLLVEYFGPDYKDYLPSKTIGNEKSTIFEVRLRIFKDTAVQLRHNITSMSDMGRVISEAEVDIDGFWKSDIAISKTSVSPWRDGMRGYETLAHGLRVEDDLYILLKEMERSQLSKLPKRPSDSRTTSGSIPRTMSATPHHSSEVLQFFGTDKQQYAWDVRESVQRRARSVKAFSAWKIAPDLYSTSISQDAFAIIQKFFPPFRLPNKMHSLLSDLRTREIVVQPLHLCISSYEQGYCSHCGLTAGSPGKDSTLIGKHVDNFGNTSLHYAVSRDQNVLNVLENMLLKPFRTTSHPRISWKAKILREPNDNNQTWLFALNPGLLNYCTDELRKVLKIAVISDNSRLDLNHQDCHGQTWLHQYMYHNDWWNRTSGAVANPEELFALELLELCKDFDINPCIRDNFDRTVLSRLTEYAHQEASDIHVNGTRGLNENVNQVLEAHTLQAWIGYRASCVESWSYWLYRVGDNLDGIRRLVESASLETLDSYDRQGNTLLLAFISITDPHRMTAKDIEAALQEILKRFPRTDMRNRKGQTPLHLATKRALPVAVTTLLRYIKARGGWAAVSKSIAVESYDGTSLVTDLRATYWDALESNEPDARFIEADTYVCLSIITNAANETLPSDDHSFRPLRQRYNERREKRRRGEGYSKEGTFRASKGARANEITAPNASPLSPIFSQWDLWEDSLFGDAL